MDLWAQKYERREIEKKWQVTKSGEGFSAGPIMGTKMMPVPRLEVSIFLLLYKLRQEALEYDKRA